MVPGDRVVVRRIEPAVVDPKADPLVRIADQTAIPGETGEDREIALGHAEGHVHARCIAPLGNDEPVAQQQTIRPAARTHRPEGLVPGRTLLEIIGDHPAEISAPRCLMFARMSRGGGNAIRVQPGFAGCCALPRSGVGWWEIGHRGSISLTRVDFSDIGTTS